MFRDILSRDIYGVPNYSYLGQVMSNGIKANFLIARSSIIIYNIHVHTVARQRGKKKSLCIFVLSKENPQVFFVKSTSQMGKICRFGLRNHVQYIKKDFKRKKWI